MRKTLNGKNPKPLRGKTVATKEKDESWKRGKMKVGSEEAINAMLDRYVYVIQDDEYYDTYDTYATYGMKGRQFNKANTSVAPFGSRGVHSAEAIFQNHPRARKVRYCSEAKQMRR